MNIDAIATGKNPPDDLNVIIEVPLGGEPIKYEIDKASGALFVDRFLYTPMRYPGNYGFVPHTLCGDGDPLDVLLFLDSAVPAGCVATARLIGVLEVEQKETRQPWTRNDRFFAVATHAKHHQRLRHLDDLRPQLLVEIEAFFTHYAGLNGKKLRVLRRSGPRRARRLLKAGGKAFMARK